MAAAAASSWGGESMSAAAGSGVRKDDVPEGKASLSCGVDDRRCLGNGVTPQEDTKEHMNIVERHLDELTYCGSAVNDLELQLSSARASYRKTLGKCKARLEETRKRLGSCISKSQPFIEVWRKARQVQEESNRAAARFDKASSQYAAAKEMIRVTEGELSNSLGRAQEGRADDESVNHALLEVLNHATRKVVETEKEKRESEAEHRQVLDHCTVVLEEYRNIERKLRPHIIKSRPYFEERWRSSQQLNDLKVKIDRLEKEVQKTKQRYADTLRKLDRLNHSIHQQRCANSLSPVPQSSTAEVAGGSDCESVQSWQIVDGVQFTGSTGSLPSIGSSIPDEMEDSQSATATSQPQRGLGQLPTISITLSENDPVSHLAHELVEHTLQSALTRLAQH